MSDKSEKHTSDRQRLASSTEKLIIADDIREKIGDFRERNSRASGRFEVRKSSLLMLYLVFINSFFLGIV